MASLSTSDLQVRYDQTTVIDALDVTLPAGGFSVIIGPNACGKSTLLKAMSRILRPSAGVVSLDGRELGARSTKELARELGVLPQSPTAPEAITVRDLVGRGRFPHQRFLSQWTAADTEASDEAMRRAGVVELADREIDTLSGGQRQRVWLAMVLAQETATLLLDEPTTFLDISHQVEVLDLAESLVERGTTVVAVLHDINLACRYANHLFCMRAGRVVASGAPADIVTAELMHDVFELDCVVVPDPETGTPMVVPKRRQCGPRASLSPESADPAAVDAEE